MIEPRNMREDKMMMEKRLVGYPSKGKGATKNYLTLPHHKYTYIHRRDLFGILLHKGNRFLPSGIRTILHYSHSGLSSKRDYAILHLFNLISLGKIPWVVTHESRLPRWGFVTGYKDTFALRNGMKLLANKSCKKILAMSRCAYNIQSIYLDDYPDLKEQILPKMEILHPPQSPLINSYSEKVLSDYCIEFTIVGHEFFRKGGLPLIKAFDFLLKRREPVFLNIVSSLNTNSSGVANRNIAYVHDILRKYPNSVRYFPSLPNDEVMKILRRTHVALLPSLDDTYGFFVLEAQANACPVISTNIRAFPELNNNKIGWVIELPLDDTFFCARGFLERTRNDKDRDVKEIEQLIQDGLIQAITEIIHNPECVRQKGMQALERIRQSHNPRVQAEKLEAIYDSIL